MPVNQVGGQLTITANGLWTDLRTGKEATDEIVAGVMPIMSTYCLVILTPRHNFRRGIVVDCVCLSVRLSICL